VFFEVQLTVKCLNDLRDVCDYAYIALHVALLLQRGRAMLRVNEYFGKALKVIRNDTVE